jgi:hypothetical protein
MCKAPVSSAWWCAHTKTSAERSAQIAEDGRDELLDRAYRYRDLAILTMGEQTKQGLLELAEKYEALARDVEEMAAPSRP